MMIFEEFEHQGLHFTQLAIFRSQLLICYLLQGREGIIHLCISIPQLWTCLSICYFNIINFYMASLGVVFCFVLFCFCQTAQQARCEFPDHGSDLYPLQWKRSLNHWTRKSWPLLYYSLLNILHFSYVPLTAPANIMDKYHRFSLPSVPPSFHCSYI